MENGAFSYSWGGDVNAADSAARESGAEKTE
jgi:hypothetical protein